MWTIISYAISNMAGKKIFSCVVLRNQSISYVSLVIPSPHYTSSDKIMRYVAGALEVKFSEISWPDTLKKPEDYKVEG